VSAATSAFDVAALLAHDPFVGVTIPDGRVTLTDAPGLGVSPAAASVSSSVSPPAGVS
jgi:hypothetical protein